MIFDMACKYIKTHTNVWHSLFIHACLMLFVAGPTSNALAHLKQVCRKELLLSENWKCVYFRLFNWAKNLKNVFVVDIYVVFICLSPF